MLNGVDIDKKRLTAATPGEEERLDAGSAIGPQVPPLP
jgi:hypothetical protein